MKLPTDTFVSVLGSAARAAGVLLLFAMLFALGGWWALRYSVSGSEVRLPGVVGLPVDEAVERLEEVGVEVLIAQERAPARDRPADVVAHQDPGEGTPLKRKRAVRLVLTAEPADRRLPELVGDYAQRTRIALEQREIRVDYEAAVHSAEVERDRIIASEPQPAELPAGEVGTVRLLKSLGPAPRLYVMVDLIGQRRAAAVAFLERNGFQVGRVRTRRYPSIEPGVVIGHVPHSGDPVAAGAEVDLEVSG